MSISISSNFKLGCYTNWLTVYNIRGETCDAVYQFVCFLGLGFVVLKTFYFYTCAINVSMLRTQFCNNVIEKMIKLFCKLLCGEYFKGCSFAPLK